MKQAFFLVSALFVLFQLGENVTAASIKASSKNSESDQQTRILKAEDQVNTIVDGLVDLLNNSVDSFQIKFDKAHQTVAEIIKKVANLPDDAPEEEKIILENAQSSFNDGHGQLMAAIDQYQVVAAQFLANLKAGIKDTLNTIVADLNAAKESSGSSAA